MALDLPKPPVPPECDLSGNDWFALHFKRLRKSRWWRRASDLARARNVMLWGAAYESIPAGSLPDDDDELAEAAGFGMDADAFIRVKAEIMAPWTLCSDGRWYHPTLVEVVIETWARTSERRKKDAGKKRDQRAKARGVPLETENVPGEISIVPGDTSENDGDKAPYAGASLTGQDKTELPQPPQGGREDKFFDEALAAYPIEGQASTNRPKALAAWKDLAGAYNGPDIVVASKAYAASDYAKAEKGKRVPSFQRWLSELKFIPWLAACVSGVRAWRGPSEIRTAFATFGEAWCASWIDGCAWRDLPERSLIAPSAFHLKRLSEDPKVTAIIASLGISLTLDTERTAA